MIDDELIPRYICLRGRFPWGLCWAWACIVSELMAIIMILILMINNEIIIYYYIYIFINININITKLICI